MPYEISLNDLPDGVAEASARKGEHTNIITREFVCSEHGDLFISRLDGFPSVLTARCGIKSSSVESLLAILRKDNTVTVYVNEVRLAVHIRCKRDTEAGEEITSDDIVDIDKVTFVNGDSLVEIEVPNESGIVWIFSAGWRKGLWYDFGPLNFAPRNYDLKSLCGQLLAYLLFQHLFKVTESDWGKLLIQRWFLFTSLKQTTIKQMLSYAREGWDIDDLIEQITAEVNASITLRIQSWQRNRYFKDHFEIISAAVERHLAGDFVSANSILYPRIEGIMRSYHADLSSGTKATQSNLIKSVIDGGGIGQNGFSLLLPDNFRRYLEEVYFENFDPSNPKSISRNTVSHGIAPIPCFDRKASLIGLLILDQLFYYLRTATAEEEQE